jgi:hypothetical protein
MNVKQREFVLRTQHLLHMEDVACPHATKIAFFFLQQKFLTPFCFDASIKMFKPEEGGGGGVNQLLPCLKNYAYFKLFAEYLMTITIMKGGKQ